MTTGNLLKSPKMFLEQKSFTPEKTEASQKPGFLRIFKPIVQIFLFRSHNLK